MRRISVVPLALSVFLWAPALVPAAKADVHDKKTIVTFSQPVEIPHRVLAPGEYVIKLADVPSRDVVQFYTKDERHLIATVIGIPDYRENPSDKTMITFEERAKGSPEAIKSWFYPDDSTGIDFVYPIVHPQLMSQNADPCNTSPAEHGLRAILHLPMHRR